MRAIILFILVIISFGGCTIIHYDARNFEEFSEQVKPRVKYEYRRQLRELPEFEGKVTFEVKYNESGYLESCEILDQKADVSVMQARICSYAFDRIRFKNKDHKTVRLSFIFKLQQELLSGEPTEQEVESQ